jgi:hypothetical protein
MLTPEEAKNLIGAVWGRGVNLSSATFNKIDPLLPHQELPILDRLLFVCDLLEKYNKAGRPAFRNFYFWFLNQTFLKKTS